MKTSDIMTHDVIALTSDDTTGKALNIMYEKRIIETTIHYFKDRTESFDDYFPCLRVNSCNLLHVHHSPHEKSIIERTVQYIKDRTEGFDDYFPCRKSNCRLQNIQKWFNLFVSHYNNNLFS